MTPQQTLTALEAIVRKACPETFIEIEGCRTKFIGDELQLHHVLRAIGDNIAVVGSKKGWFSLMEYDTDLEEFRTGISDMRRMRNRIRNWRY